MKASQSQLFSLLFLLFTTFSAAWPWPRWAPELEALVPRQNGNGNETPATSTRPPQSSRTSTNAPTPTGSETVRQTDNSGTPTRSATKSRITSYDPTNPAGGVVMVTPAVIEGSQYFKVGDQVTFAWNYTNLLATPTAVNIVASCAANNQIYTIAENQKVGNSSNATEAVTWDTGKYQETNLATPLLTEKYTLIIYDAQSSISANSQPGYLAVYNQYQFGMYVPQPYTPLGEWICSTCSGALSDVERKALGMVVGMSVLTVLSFTWFVGGTGVIW